jgi:ornithine cyclodeaminase/alanine dehydrogenase-like protein (mu-crystallin family)
LAALATGEGLLVLSRDDVAALLPMNRAIDVVRAALAEYSGGHADVPLRTPLHTDEPAGEMLFMPAHLPRLGAIGLKVWSRFSTDAGATAIVLYRDLRTGRTALLDGGYLTDARTGAMSAVAARLLASPAARRLAVLGAGFQARTQLEAIVTEMDIRDVRVWSRTESSRIAFASEAATNYGIDVTPAGSAEEAVRGADIVATATTSPIPVVEDAWLEQDALVCGIGSHTPDTSEMEPATVARARTVVVDSRRGVLAGGGDVIEPIRTGVLREEDVVELGELVAGTRETVPPPGIAVFKSVGFAALDLAAAKAVVDAALEQGAGSEVALR